MKPTLYILAAGMGSRYGGLKQLDGLGPNGETIMDYSVYDALHAGFGKIVFVIRHDFEEEFRHKIISKYENHVPVEVVFQELKNIPEEFEISSERCKPWGTAHAVLMGKDVIKEPFAVINADDYYGRDSFMVLANFLKESAGVRNKYCMVGFNIGNTLSENGGVSRGLCQVNSEGYLVGVQECHGIQRKKEAIIQELSTGAEVVIAANTIVSMNMWGFTPDFFEYSEESFRRFLHKNSKELKAEFYIPTVVNELVDNKTITLKVLTTPSKWFGVTYAADKPTTIAQFAKLVNEGVYPSPLFK